MAGELSFRMGDLYPDLGGFYGTRSTTIPEAKDQNALVDDEEAAKDNSVHTTPTQHRNIFLSIIAVFVIMFVVSKF